MKPRRKHHYKHPTTYPSRAERVWFWQRFIMAMVCLILMSLIQFCTGKQAPNVPSQLWP